MSNAIPENRFKYYEEDCRCEYCINFRRRSKYRLRGCDRNVCCCADIRANALAHGRIKRKRGSMTWDM